MDENEVIPEDAVQTGSVEVRCAQCETTVDVPVYAWLVIDQLDSRQQFLATKADMTEMWSHVWAAHPQ